MGPKALRRPHDLCLSYFRGEKVGRNQVEAGEIQSGIRCGVCRIELHKFQRDVQARPNACQYSLAGVLPRRFSVENRDLDRISDVLGFDLSQISSQTNDLGRWPSADAGYACGISRKYRRLDLGP